ncbi:MAG: site-2 protease family protein [Planctomycetales bacterium]
MLLGEPPQTSYDLRFQLMGIPVRIHPFFWLITLLLGIQLKDPMFVLIWVLCAFISILIHELGHALAALAHGWKPWITLYGLGGLASYQPTRHDARSQIIISLAGPAAGFLFIAFVMAAVNASGHPVSFVRGELLPFWVTFEPFENMNMIVLIHSLLWINILWGLINLLPVYPLDGGQVAREICLSLNPRGGIVQSLWISIFTAGAVAVLSLVHFRDFFVAFMFGFLAYENYTTLQRFTGRGGGGSGNPWDSPGRW